MFTLFINLNESIILHVYFEKDGKDSFGNFNFES